MDNLDVVIHQRPVEIKQKTDDHHMFCTQIIPKDPFNCFSVGDIAVTNIIQIITAQISNKTFQTIIQSLYSFSMVIIKKKPYIISYSGIFQCRLPHILKLLK